jgi:HTH-type transcriptional regulator / antitoxin HigA
MVNCSVKKEVIMNQATIQYWNALQDSVGNILQPVQSETHYDQLAALLDDLLDLIRDQPSHALRGLLEMVVKLITDYDQAHPLELSAPHEMLAWYMENSKINQVQLAVRTGIDQSLISKHLKAIRPIPKANARAYAKVFAVPVDLFSRV